MNIDCPHCRSSIVIPAQATESVQVLVKRRLATIAGSADGAYEELERKQRELSVALDEAAKLRAESEKTQSEIERLRGDLAAVSTGRGGEIQTELDQARTRLVAMTNERDTLVQRLASLEPLRREQSNSQIELGRLRSEVSKLTAERDALQARPPVIEVAKTMEGQAGPWKQEREQMEAQMIRLQDQLSTLTSERDSLKINSGHAVDEVKGLRNELTQLRSEHQLVQARLHETTNEFDQAKQQRDEAQNRLTTLQKDAEEVVGLRETGSRLQIELNEARATLTEREQALEQLTQASEAAKSQAQQAQSQLDETTRLRDTLQTERDDARQQLADREDALRLASVTMEAAKKELDRLKQDAAQGSEEHGKLKEQWQEASEEAKELQHRVDNLLDDLHARESDLANTRQTLEHTSTARDTLRTQLVEKDLHFQEASKQLGAAQEEARELRQRVDSLVGNLNNRERELSDLTALRDTTQQQLGQREREVQEMQAKLTSLQQEVAARLEALCNESEAKLSEVSAERDRAQLELTDRQARTFELETRISTLQGELERTQQSTEDLSLQLQASRQEIQPLADRLAEVQARIKSVQEAERAALTKAAEADQAREAAQDKAQLFREDRDRLVASLDRLQNDVNTANEQLKVARQEREAMRSTVSSMEIELEQSLDQLHAVETEREALKSELEAVKAGLERAKQHVSVLQSRRDQMREEIARLKVQLGQSPDAPA